MSSQVYGSKKASSKPADKWLALSVDHLMQKYPALRIAYIDTARSIAVGGKGTPMSVLLRWNADEEEVQECYRVRLPDQREDGRGVVRCASLPVLQLMLPIPLGLCSSDFTGIRETSRPRPPAFLSVSLNSGCHIHTLCTRHCRHVGCAHGSAAWMECRSSGRGSQRTRITP